MPSVLETSGSPESIAPLHSLSERYELLGRLGEGGMAEVWLARAVGLDEFEKIVVLKRILTHHRDNPRFVGMLRDEARVAVHLHHPNIVHTYDIGLIDGEYFFTMEYLHGENLKTILSRAAEAGEAVPLELILQIAVGCAAGLHHAHEQSDYAGKPLEIVHRDVSPSNIIVTWHSGVKLIDFGIAKAASGKEVTAVGMVKGKSAYMSPEQCRGEPLDRRSDVFSLGIVLYEMLTMKRAFARENQMATLYAILNADVEPIEALRPDCPPELGRIVNRALAKRRDDRYQTAFEMQEELELATRDCRLHALPGALSRYLEHLFGPKPPPWSTGDRPPPSPEPRSDLDFLITTRRRQRVDQPSDSNPLETERGRTEPEVRPVEAQRTTSTVVQTEPSAAVALPPAMGPIASSIVHREARVPEHAAERRIGVFVGIAGTLVLAALAAIRWWAPAEPTSSPTPNTAAVDLAEARQPTPLTEPRPPSTPPPSPEHAALRSMAEDAEAAENEAAESESVDAVEPAATQRTAKRPQRAGEGDREAQARALVEKGQAALIRGDSEKALALAKQALRKHATQDVYALLGAAACRLGRTAEAQVAQRHLSGSRRADLARVCSKHGTAL